MKKIISIILVLTMLATTFILPINAHAEETAGADSTTTGDGDFTVESTNSFGDLLTQTIGDEMQKQLDGNGYNVFSINVEENFVTVEYEALDSCTLVVCLYDELGESVLAYESVEVSSDESSAEIEIAEEDMPQYFVAGAYLVKTEDLKPLCTAYVNSLYTEEMQEFLSKTSADFDQDRVVNFDDNETTNYAVYNDEVNIVSDDSNSIQVTEDDASNTYVFENADSDILSLTEGEILAFEAANGDLIIVKVKTITIDDTTATIVGDETSLDEVFDYVRIEGGTTFENTEIDPSGLEEGIEYNGAFEGPSTFALADISKSKSISASYTFAEKEFVSTDSKKVTLNGEAMFTIKASMDVYVSLRYSTVEVKLEYSFGVEIKVSGSIAAKIPLGYIAIAVCPGVYISFTPSFILELSGEVSVSGELKGQFGFKASTDTKKIKNTSSTPKFECQFKMEATVFIGISLEPSVAIISKKVAEAKMSGRFGAEIKGALCYTSAESTSQKHECKSCIDGDFSARTSLSFEAKFLNLKKLTFKLTIMDKKIKLRDFYYSFDHDEFGFGTCPYISYSFIVNVLEGKDVVQGASVKISSGSEDITKTTDKDGKIEAVYLKNGKYTVTVTKKDFINIEKSYKIKDKGRDIRLSLNKTPVDTSSQYEFETVALGSYHSAAITKDGKLYTWGANDYGQLGDGTTANRLTPKYIMSNVASVSLGCDHSAAVTKDGKLYTWGRNNYGQLGDGTTTNSKTPKHIMSNVASVNLEDSHSAAITKDGKLYTWGYNGSGQLGNGTTANRSMPKCIMNNILSFNFGDFHSAAITKDGKLYTWGSNSWGMLGDGTTTNSLIPKYIMNNVKMISLNGSYSTAITKDGKLYAWGFNYDGQLGDGTTTNRLTPKYIMSNVASASTGFHHSAAITKDGKLYTWGDNYYGQLGDGRTTNKYTPKYIMSNMVSVSLGDRHSAAITKDGKLYTWGDNYYGQLGDGTTTDRLTPKQITLPGATSLASYNTHSFVNDDNVTVDNSGVTVTGLKPKYLYNFYAVKSKTVENPLESGNLLYLVQAQTDESGVLSIGYTPQISYVGAGYIVAAYTRAKGDWGYIYNDDDSLSVTGYYGDDLNIEIPTEIDGIAVTGIDDCFSCDDDVTDITVPDSITSATENAFILCKKATVICSCENIEVFCAAILSDVNYSLIHTSSDTLSVYSQPTEILSGKYYSYCENCGDTIKSGEFDYLRIFESIAKVHGEKSVDFKLSAEQIENSGYASPYLVIEISGTQSTITDYEIVDEYYVFNAKINDNQVNTDINATVYATFNGTEYMGETETTTVYNIGDINLDKKVDTSDLLMIQQYLLDIDSVNSDNFVYTDYNGNGIIDSTDIVLLQMLMLEIA
ncbi:MAG: hypothetical protein IJE65_03775 [Clostridia bacterium]|nr:hypothetical protein [Clostridia bacterium]